MDSTTIFRAVCLSFLSFILWGCSTPLYYPAKQELVDRTKMPLPPEDVYFFNSEGLRLHAWRFSPPKNVSPKGIILHFHGNAENLTSHFMHFYKSPNYGFIYFIFDYRGFGKSEGHPDPRGTVEDGKSALRWVTAEYPKLPLIVIGQSLGGAIAMRSILDIKTELDIKLVVMDSTFNSYRSAARSTLSRHWLTFIFQPLGWAIVDNSQSPSRDIEKLSPTPLLVIHGSKDRIVSPSLGRALYEKAPEPKRFWEVPEGSHTDFVWRESGKYESRFYSFLEKCIKNKSECTQGF